MIRKLFIISATALFIFGCKGRDKSTTDSANAGGAGAMTETAPVDSTPMNFDAQGSDSGNIAGLATVYFDFDKSNLSEESRNTLKSNAEWMKKNKNVRVQIEGHTDSRGSIEYNLALGERRANAVVSYMKSLGIPANRMSVISYGEEKPIMSGENENAWAKNRRGNFVPAQ
ncbi:MAG: peptidoglycan-associated lipoprotein Pal [Bdellovibrionales bacterium]